MSSTGDRRSFYGIAPTWIAISDGTPGPPFTILINSLNAKCEFDLIGDVPITNILNASCTIGFDGVLQGITMLASCGISLIGDIQPGNTLNTFCSVVVSGP